MGRSKAPSLPIKALSFCRPTELRGWQRNWIHRGATRPANPVTCFPPGKVVAQATKGGDTGVVREVYAVQSLKSDSRKSRASFGNTIPRAAVSRKPTAVQSPVSIPPEPSKRICPFILHVKKQRTSKSAALISTINLPFHPVRQTALLFFPVSPVSADG